MFPSPKKDENQKGKTAHFFYCRVELYTKWISILGLNIKKKTISNSHSLTLFLLFVEIPPVAQNLLYQFALKLSHAVWVVMPRFGSSLSCTTRNTLWSSNFLI